MDGWNYFNYFTEIEEYFWKKRGAHLLVSPLDWAIMETWQRAGVPLESGAEGDRPRVRELSTPRDGEREKPLKSLAYCTDAVLQATGEGLEAAAGSAPQNGREAKEAFPREELKAYLARNAARVAAAAKRDERRHPEMTLRLAEIAESVRASSLLLDSPAKLDLEDLERRLTVLDDKISALVMMHATEDLMLRVRREVDGQLSTYRRKMKAEQLALVEKKYTQKRLLEEFGLPRPEPLLLFLNFLTRALFFPRESSQNRTTLCLMSYAYRLRKLVYGGDGLAHADGNTIFVLTYCREKRCALPPSPSERSWCGATAGGDFRFRAARRSALPAFSNLRRLPLPAHSGSGAIAAEDRDFARALSRLGGIQWSGPIQEHSAEPYGYRNRAQWAVRNANSAGHRILFCRRVR